MKIRQLQIQGFKSFADRTRFEFGDGITVVVGPNGCGKSNIVDAIKWVLGDMSPRSLRSKRMEDVIFAGSRHRRPVGFSEVSLLLDNSDGQLHTERTDVEITRRLHRSGVSEYLLGGRPARLKDIRELFLDTGLGIEGNTIMEQGQIDALLAANPQDRRGLFEEAAGISRYKQRRKEAEQRLRRTQENLDRLLDVLELEEKRLRSLKNQAGRARRYQQLREELVRKRILRGVLRYREVAAERQRLQAEMEGALARERGVAADLEALRAARRKAEAERLEAREAVHAVQARVAQAVSDQRAAADRQTFGAKRRDALGARIEAARRECEEARAQAARRTEEIGGLEAEVEAASGEAEEHARCLADADAVRARLEAEAASIREAHRGAKRSALAALGRISEVRNARSERRVEIRQLEERIRRLGRQRADLVARRDRLETRLADLRARADRMEAAARLGAEALASAEAETAAARRAVEAARASRVALSEKRATQAARLDVLDRLAAAHEGVDQGAREILETLEGREPDEDGSRDGVHGILADLVSVRPEDAALLDRLLGPAAGALVVRTSDDALRWIRWLREHRGEARARFLALDLVRAGALPLPEVVGPLGCDEELAALVSSVAEGVALVDDLDEAIGRWRRGRVNAVTPRGERITASGALLGGRDGAALGLVGRTAERAGLRQAVDGMDRRVEAARREEQEAVSRLEEAEGRIAGRRRALAQRAEDRSRGSEALTGTERELGHVARTLAVLDGDIADLVDGLEFAHEAMAVVGRRLAAIEAERVRIEAEAAAVEERSVEIERALKGAGERRMEARLALAGSRARGEGARGRLARVREEVESLGARARVLAEELADLDRQRSEVEVEITEAEALARRADRERRAGGQALLEARERLEALDGRAGSEDARRTEVQRRYESVREQLEDLRVKDSELRVRIEALMEQVRQDHGLDLGEVERETAADGEVDVEAIAGEVEDLRRRMENLGNVNLNAIVELEEVAGHVKFLRGQEKDLLDAKTDLAHVIEELNEVSTSRFAETFEQVRGHFRETFRRLFGGGRADIVLEDASNLLESGVDIIARPPGKEQRSISLLSGGERTLTAVALLFAVFKAKPSPFAILDEVDAALDEANVRRLIGLVREFTDRSQFLVVTHAKTTMEAADMLYGVTMEEPGVSKRVAVRLTDYPAESLAAG